MENVLFNQSLFGFDRGQVLKYIDDMSAQMSRQAREYAKKQTDLQEETTVHLMNLTLSLMK